MADATSSPLQLRDIHLPEPISWWPPAPGWWWLLGLVLIIIATLFLLRFYRKRQALKKNVMAEFKNICAHYEKNNNTTALVQSLSVLLRRACISFYPRSETAGLTGDAWLAFLDSTSKEKLFNTEHGRLLITAPYFSEKTRLDIDPEKLIRLCESWLKTQPDKNHQPVAKP